MNPDMNEHSDVVDSATISKENANAIEDFIRTTTPVNDIDKMEDLKTDIPYFDVTLNNDNVTDTAVRIELSGCSTPRSCTNNNENYQNKSDANDDQMSSIGDYTQWDDNDEQYLDDNVSVMGSDYASSAYAASTPAASSSSYHELQQPSPDMKYLSTSPNTPSNYNYHMNDYAMHPVTSSHHLHTHTQRLLTQSNSAAPPPLPPHGFTHTQALQARTQAQLLAHGGAGAGDGAGDGGSSNNSSSSNVGGGGIAAAASGFYPNMWYPNASYGTGGGGAAAAAAAAAGTNIGIGHPSSNNGIDYNAPYSAAAQLHHQQQQHQRFGAYHAAYAHHAAQNPHMHTHPHAHTHHTQHPHETMLEMFQLSNSGREARNRAEKNRRDKLNGSIQELSTMVPHVAESPRRVDKTAVLRFAAHGLRLKYVFGKSLKEKCPQLTDTLMNMLDSFFLTVTCHGQILLISSSVEQHLGHCQADLYGQNILHITHPEDQNTLKQQLIPTDLENLFDVHADDADENGEQRQRTDVEEEYIDRKLREDRRSFRIRLARAGPRSEPTTYEVVKIDGCFRRSDEAPRGIKTSTFSTSLQLIRRTRGRDDAIPLQTISGNDIVLTARARIIRPPKIINRLVDANTLAYRTRHLIDGRIIDCDQRIGLVAGYMTDEVLNLSPFTFMHNDDVRWVIVALRQMYDCNSSYGESTYRLFTRNGSIIYLQSKGYLEIDKKTNKVHSFVCVNTLLDEEEGKRRVQEMKKKFSVIVNTKIPQSSIDVPASENPQQLEKAVLCLIQNLQKSASDEDDDNDGSEMDLTLNDYAATLMNSSTHEQQPHQRKLSQITEYRSPSSHDHNGQSTSMPSSSSAAQRHLSDMSSARLAAATATGTKTPPLALVPPEASSVKSSITKSVNAVNITAAKHLRGIQQQQQLQQQQQQQQQQQLRNNNSKSPMHNACSCQQQQQQQQPPESSSEGDCELCCQSPLTPDTTVVLKRSSLSISDAEDVQSPKRRLTDIEQVLSSSIDQIGRTLNQQLNAVIELRDQGHKYEVPNSTQRIVEIMEEHHKQSEIYVNIKSEYQVQIQNKANTTKSESEPPATQGNGDELRPR